MEQRWKALGSESYMQFMVISQTPSATLPDATYCKQVRAQYGLTFPVLYDPTGIVAQTYQYGSVNERHWVIGLGNHLIHFGHYTSQSLIAALIDGLLAE